MNSSLHSSGQYRTLVTLLCTALASAALRAGEEDSSYRKDETKKAAAELIMMQLQNEVLYASDNYFGDNYDVSYADGVAPSKPAEKAPEKQEPTVSSKSKPKPSSSSSESTLQPAAGTTSSGGGSSSDSDGSGGSDGGGGSDPDPGDPPPPVEPPVIEPPPPYPT